MNSSALKALRDAIVFATLRASSASWGDFRPAPHCPDHMRAWGFQFKKACPWIERAGNGNPAMGILARPGSRTIRWAICFSPATGCSGRSIDSTVVDRLRREHSRKSDEMIPLIENLLDSPCLELFARTQRPGWTTWGNQTDKLTTDLPLTDPPESATL